MNTKPRICVIDFETSPGTAYFYGSFWEPVIVKWVNYMQILSMAATEVGSNKIKYFAQNKLPNYVKGELNDKELIIQICDYLKDFDYICGHNLDQFDMNVLKERILFNRLPPFPDIPTLDTKKLIKTTSRLPSNKLQHVTEFLGNGGKLAHDGTDLFVKCMEGDEKAWRLNEKYNKMDVKITAKDFEDMLPYVKLSVQQKAFSHNIQCSNPLCLSHNLIVSQTRRVKNGWKKQYRCKDCGKMTQDDKLIKE